MDYLISLLFILPCAHASAYSSAHASANTLGVGRLIPLRKNAYPVYASDSSGEEYEPYAVAALPFHQPVPILQVLSPTPYRSKRRPAKRPKPETELYAFDASQIEPAYEPVEYEELYTSSEETQPKYSSARDQYDDESASVVVYARPNKHGGYSYRRRPQTTRVASTPLPTFAPRLKEPQEPVIIRIHKYKVIH